MLAALDDAGGAGRGPPHDRFRLLARGLELIDSYFAVMIAVVAVLALASARRYYLVTTLGERIVADLRERSVRPSHLAVACLSSTKPRPAR